MTTLNDILLQARKTQEAGDLDGAERLYRQALAAAPNDANAWCYLGIVLYDQGRLNESEAAYRRAIQLQPNFPVAYNNLGNTLRLLRRLDDSLKCFDRAIELKPDYANAYKNKGMALSWEGHLDGAADCFHRALELAPDDADAHKNLGIIWLLQGKFEQGWREYEWRSKLSGAKAPTRSRPAWDGTPLDGRTILLVSEQGLGDTIHFVRYAAALKARYACRVIVQCQSALLPLLHGCPGVDSFVSTREEPGEFDVFASLLSVPGILGHTTEDFPADVPYLKADSALVSRWKEELDRLAGMKVGVVWQGSREFGADHIRSVPLAEMAPLGRVEGLQLIGLQKGDGVEHVESLAGRFRLVHWGDRLDETTGPFLDTAAVLQNLDLLITVDTAVAHLAGALGVPTWLALAYVPDWRWMLDRDDSPWYPSVRLFRQRAFGDWASVFEAMAAELCRNDPRVRWKRPEEYRLAACGRNRLTSTRHGLMLYNRHDKYIGRSLDRYGEFSEGECGLFDQVLRPGAVVVEAGANVGAHTLPLARLVGSKGAVHAFEPQRLLFHCLCANMALNGIGNVCCRCEALAAEAGELWVPTLNYEGENNFGGLSLGRHTSGERVPAVTVDSLELTRCELIKADVEGMELAVLQGAAATIERCRPILYVENDRRDLSAPLIEYLQSLGYVLYWHLPPLFHRGNYFGNQQNEFANIVSVNMLGVHSSVKAEIAGLRRVEGPQSDWRIRETG